MPPLSRERVFRTLRLTVQYDGTDLVGWQRQARGVSVQGLIEDALAAFEGGPVALHGAGRTDAGVHALAQVASVRLTATHPAEAIRRGLNAVLPAAIRVDAVAEAPPAFHARFDSTGKTYEYRVVNARYQSPFLARYAWHVPQPLDFAAMQRAADLLLGRRDFAAFQGRGSAILDTVRTLETIVWQPADAAGGARVVRITADGFLRHMVRNIVGTLVDVGLGRWPADALVPMLASGDRRRTGRTAPAQGLFLAHVRY